MAEQNNKKDTSKSLGKYSDLLKNETNLALNSVELVNKLYQKNLNNISESDIRINRIETKTDDKEETSIVPVENNNKIATKVNEYTELQTNIKKSEINTNNIKIQTRNNENNFVVDEYTKNLIKTREKKKRISKRISTSIRGMKFLNKTTNKIIKSGRNINTGINENGLKSFESSSKILTKPAKHIAKRTTKKATNKLAKSSVKVIKKSASLLVRLVKTISIIVANTVKALIAMLPSIAPVIIILLIIICFCSFFGIGMTEETRAKYEKYMMDTQNKYDEITVNFYNQGKIVDGAIEGKGMINWRAALSIMQMLNGDLVFDSSEQNLLNNFDSAGLYETITDEEYTYEEEKPTTDENGNTTTTKETISDTKKIVYNPSLDDYIDWCNKNFYLINAYKRQKGLNVNPSQIAFTDNEISQIKTLYGSNYFFDLFSDEFKKTYAYAYVEIGDEQLQAIYNEFLKNAGKRYVMDHSNLSYDTCMNYYDCSSWVIHCLAHTGIKVLPNTTAAGIYSQHCNPVNVNDRKAGDLIFLKDTYNTGVPGGISHIGIYMGTFNINGEIAEWIIDTGGNPSGVKISKYNNGWWNGSHFYGFGRLK